MPRRHRSDLTPPPIGRPLEIGSPPPIPKPPKIGRPTALMAPHPIERPAPDPLAEVDYQGDPQVDARAELDALAVGFRARAKADRLRMQMQPDSEFYTVLVFDDRIQRQAFLDALGIADLGARFIDGRKAAAALNISLPTTPLRYTAATPEKRLRDLAMDAEPSEVPD